MSPTPVLVIAGPTASGKTGAALALARAARARGLPPVEIISVDSALVYRGMDIGTAKPTPAERAEVPHHLIDLIEPTAAYSAAEFVADTRRLIGEIRARGAEPVLAGGTMLYLKALFDGLDMLPPADATLRAELDAQAAQIGWPAMHAELAPCQIFSTIIPSQPGRMLSLEECLRPLHAFYLEKKAELSA